MFLLAVALNSSKMVIFIMIIKILCISTKQYTKEEFVLYKRIDS
jgi:hypothetical protein